MQDSGYLYIELIHCKECRHYISAVVEFDEYGRARAVERHICLKWEADTDPRGYCFRAEKKLKMRGEL